MNTLQKSKREESTTSLSSVPVFNAGLFIELKACFQEGGVIPEKKLLENKLGRWCLL
jgi:hypothetical protein